MTSGQDNKAAGAAPETPKTSEERIKALEDVVFELIGKFEEFTKEFKGFSKQVVTKPKGLFGGKREATPQKDLKTGTVYPSKAAVGKNFAAEAGADPADTMAWYTVLKVLKMPDGVDRFVDASPEEAAKSRAEYKAKIEAEVAEKNRQLEAEEAKKTAAAVPVAAKPAAQQPKKK